MTSDNTNSCDRCGRSIPKGKGYLLIAGWKICGVCQWEDERVKLFDKNIQ